MTHTTTNITMADPRTPTIVTMGGGYYYYYYFIICFNLCFINLIIVASLKHQPIPPPPSIRLALSQLLPVEVIIIILKTETITTIGLKIIFIVVQNNNYTNQNDSNNIKKPSHETLMINYFKQKFLVILICARRPH